MKSTGKNTHAGTSHYYSWVIALLLVAVFVISQTAPKPLAVFSTGAGVVFKAKQGVALTCALRYDTNLDQLLEQGAQLGVPVTYFVPLQWAQDQKNAILLKSLQSFPNECYLLGTATTPAQLKTELAMARALGVAIEFYMPAQDESAQTLASACKKLGSKLVLCSFELRQMSSDQETFVRTVKEKWFDGAIVRFQPTKTITNAFGDIINTLRLDGAVFTPLSHAI